MISSGPTAPGRGGFASDSYQRQLPAMGLAISKAIWHVWSRPHLFPPSVNLNRGTNLCTQYFILSKQRWSFFKDSPLLEAYHPFPVSANHGSVQVSRFLWTVLKLPVPEILAYSTLSDNLVGADYIPMERAEGDNLPSRWLSLMTDEIKDVMIQIAMERKIFNFDFPAYGCLYHKKDIKEGET